LAFVVPSLLFAIILNSFFFGWSYSVNLLQDVNDKSVAAIVYYIAAIWLVAIILSAFNFWIYRVFEGYLPPVSWLRFRQAKYQALAAQTKTDLQQLFEKLKANQPADQKTRAADLANYNFLYRKSLKFPPRKKDIQPTSFGNAIKCIETYAVEVYGADTVVLWPHLLPVTSDAYAAALADARGQIDFFINCTFFSMMISAISFVAFVHKAAVLPHFPTREFLWFGVSASCGWFTYKAAVAAIPQWGDLVKAGFDCYLPELAKRLGFDLPKTDARRKKFWRDFSEQAKFRVRPDGCAIFKAEEWLFPPRK
jgi:hypothetical protein